MRKIAGAARGLLLLTGLIATAQPAAARLRFRVVPIVHHQPAAMPVAPPDQSARLLQQSSVDEAERDRKIELVREGKLLERHAGESDAAYEQRKAALIAIYRGESAREQAAAATASAQSGAAAPAAGDRHWVASLLLLGLIGAGKAVLRAMVRSA